jgi:CelD/BcsL family acetyltransferase involved in cellulose biosynthesis
MVSEAADESDLRGWYRLYLETMRWHFLPARPYRFFDALWELLRPRGMMRLLLARHEGRLIAAGSVFLMYGKTIFYAFNGRRHRDLNLNPNYAIQWRSLVDASRDGFERYDFGEVAEGRQGLADFKSKWGAESQMLHRYYYPSVPGGRSGESDAGPARMAHLARLAWRRLPLRLTGKVGSLIYDFL